MILTSVYHRFRFNVLTNERSKRISETTRIADQHLPHTSEYVSKGLVTVHTVLLYFSYLITM